MPFVTTVANVDGSNRGAERYPRAKKYFLVREHVSRELARKIYRRYFVPLQSDLSIPINHLCNVTRIRADSE